MKNVLFLLTLTYSRLIHLASALQDTLKLYTIPSFQIHLTMNDSPELNLNQIGSTELIQMSSLIKAATTEHMYSFIEAYLFDKNVQNGIKSVDLDVAVHNEWNENTVRSDVMGLVTFSSLALKNADFDLTLDLFQRLVEASFDNFHTFPGEGDALDAFLTTLQDVIPLVVAVDVSFEDSKESSGNIPPKFIYDSETLNSNGGGAGYTTVSVAAAVVVLAAGLFVYSSKKREVAKDRHLLTYIDSYDEENGVLFDPYETSYKTEEGVQFVPVPAKKENISKEHRKYGLVPKVYVQASSPLEVVYGASFSHRDQAKVARAHGNRNFRPSKVGGKKLKKKAPLEPLSAISEIIEDEGKALVTEYDEFDTSPRRENEGSLLSELIVDVPGPMKTPVKDFIEDQSGNFEDDDIEDDILSYDNLSRHDDTDCASFSPICDVDWSQNTSVIEELHAISPRQVKHDQESMNDAHQVSCLTFSSFSTSPEKEVEIDNFVDKLETLIAARSRQYQERMTLEKEMDEMRIIKSEDSFNSPEDGNNGSENESNLVDQASSNELLDTEEIQPKKLFPFEEDEEDDLDSESIRSNSDVFNHNDDSSATTEIAEESSFPVPNDSKVCNLEIDAEEALVSDALDVPEATESELSEEIDVDRNLKHDGHVIHDKSIQNMTEKDCLETSESELSHSNVDNSQLTSDRDVVVENGIDVKESNGCEERSTDSEVTPMDQVSVSTSVEQSANESDATDIFSIQGTKDAEERESESGTGRTEPDASLKQQTPDTLVSEEGATGSDSNILFDQIPPTSDVKESA